MLLFLVYHLASSFLKQKQRRLFTTFLYYLQIFGILTILQIDPKILIQPQIKNLTLTIMSKSKTFHITTHHLSSINPRRLPHVANTTSHTPLTPPTSPRCIPK